VPGGCGSRDRSSVPRQGLSVYRLIRFWLVVAVGWTVLVALSRAARVGADTGEQVDPPTAPSRLSPDEVLGPPVAAASGTTRLSDVGPVQADLDDGRRRR
jgi:hypothetical protein